MKSLRSLLDRKDVKKKIGLDDKTIFYLFKKIIKEELGNVGLEKLKPDYFFNGTIFIKSESSAFASEVELQKNKIIRQINQEIGCAEIKNIKLK